VLLLDVNILVYAHREDAPRHAEYRSWLEGILGGDESYGVCDLACSGFLRVVTHARVFTPPTPLESALAFLRDVRDRPNASVIAPGERHWDIFTSICVRAGARGNLVPDAYFAALAIEAGCTWVTADRDFARFVGLRWIHPLD
jgi:toxin-antitoxin system PIN domain toxin